MDNAFDFSNPGGSVEELRTGWNNFLSDPRGRAALLSFGTQMMQPPEFGQNAAAQFGTAVGQGGEGARNVEAQALKAQEADSKELLRAAQADRAVAGASAAGARLDAAGARLGYQQEAERGKNERARYQNMLRVQGLYRDYQKEMAKQKIFNPNAQELSMPQWLEANPHLKVFYQGGEPGADVPLTATGTSGGPDAGGGGGGPAYPPAPRNPADRKAGTMYQGVNGPATWDGKQWVR